MDQENPLDEIADSSTSTIIRIVVIEPCVTSPGPLDHSNNEIEPGATFELVPVLRVFGTTPGGKQACLHLHQIYPYFFIPYDGEPNEFAVSSYMYLLTQSINAALTINVALNQSKTSYVAGMTLVKGLPFYGYHNAYRFFLKIYLTDPSMLKKVAELCSMGAILNTVLQPYEAHIPYTSQFLLDFRLYGMGWLHVQNCVWRKSRQGELPKGAPPQRVHLVQETYCELELDATGHGIQVAPFTRAVQSLESYWEDEARRREKMGLPPLAISKCTFEHPPIPENQSDASGFLFPHEHSLPGTYSKDIQISLPPRDVGMPQGESTMPKMTQELLAWMLEQHQGSEDDAASNASFQAFHEVETEELPPFFEFEFDRKPSSSPPSLPQWDGCADVPQKTTKKKRIEVYVDVPPPPRPRIAPPTASVLNLNAKAPSIFTPLLKKAASSSGLNSAESLGTSFSSIYQPHQPSPSDSMPTIHDSPSLPENGYRRKLRPRKVAAFRHRSTSRYSKDPKDETSAHSLSPKPPSLPSSDAHDSTTAKLAESNIVPKNKRESLSAWRRFREFQKFTKNRSDQTPNAIPSKTPLYASTNKRAKKSSRCSSKAPIFSSNRAIPSLPLPTQNVAPAFTTSAVIRLGTRSTQTDLSPSCNNEMSISSQPSISQPLIRRSSVIFLPSNKDLNQPLFEEAQFPLSSSMMHISDALPLESSHDSVPPSCGPTLSSKPRLRLVWEPPPPKMDEIEAQLLQLKLPLQIHKAPFYSKPEIPRAVQCDLVDFHESLYDTLRCPRPLYIPSTQTNFVSNPVVSWVYEPPPTLAQAMNSLMETPLRKNEDRSQIDIENNEVISLQLTPRNEATASSEKNHFKCMIIEVHVTTEDKLLPNPVTDEIQFISFAFICDAGVMGTQDEFKRGLLVNNAKDKVYLFRKSATEFLTEFDLLLGLINLVRDEDPDALLGYNVRSSSWGFVFERALRAYALDLSDALSRIVTSGLDTDDPKMLYRKAASFKPTGRLVINVWRWFQEEVATTDYSIEKVCQLILKRRIPRFPFYVLTAWWDAHPHRVLEYYLVRVSVCSELIRTCDFINRTCEFARTYGMDFNSVLTRGSQFRVESTLLRITRQLHFVLITPSRAQVNGQRAAEAIPLVMEPESAFYPDPVIVLDFQALYPSVMIAYNMCYSTCIGKETNPALALQKLGITQYACPTAFKDEDVFLATNGIHFVQPHIRKSVLAAMLTELLETRLMVKKSMKLYSSNKVLTKVLDARQLCLKLLSNVTYGYTAASFSGRMPLVEIGDAIVSTSRSVLENAIQLISQNPAWGARVVYGDTDSLFVQVKNCTKQRAFQIGREIAEAVTSANKPPIKLNFEKVYWPCVLITKKRYIGYKYESEQDTVPIFDAKGIETVRRDGCPAVAKILKRSLEILFDTRDLSELKAYMQRQFEKILEHRVSAKDFIIAKEVKLGSYSDRTLPPPGAYLSLKRMELDPRAEPAMGERVPYVIVYGAPGDRLIDQVMLVDDFLDQPNLFLNGQYYILHLIIPALQRIFELLSVDILAWYNEVRRPMKHVQYSSSQRAFAKRATIDQYYTHCVCGNKATTHACCEECFLQPERKMGYLIMQLKEAEQRYQSLATLCFDCMQFQDREIECDSFACDILFDRVKARQRMRQLWSQAEELYLNKKS